MLKYKEEYKLDKPETIGETDYTFDLDNYREWLEEQLTECRKQQQVKNNDLLHSVSERFSKIEKDAKVDAEAYAVLCDSEDYGEGIRRGVMYGIDYVKKRLFNADEILRLFIVNKDIEKAIRLLKLEVKHYETCSPDALTGIKVRLEELETAVKNCSKH